MAALLVLVAWSLMGQGNEPARTPLGQPLARFRERPKLLTFGLYVTPNPDQNPIDPPERFVGYHTALDVETFDDEAGVAVEVVAVCDGTVVEARTADGYGGVLVHTCTVGGQAVTVLYGHMDPDSFTRKIGDPVTRGQKLAELGNDKSAESGLTRKHLHLGIHRGAEPALLGYVQTEAALDDYMDPLPLMQ